MKLYRSVKTLRKKKEVKEVEPLKRVIGGKFDFKLAKKRKEEKKMSKVLTDPRVFRNSSRNLWHTRYANSQHYPRDHGSFLLIKNGTGKLITNPAPILSVAELH